ncbi:MAG: hypothetical protein F4Y01_10755 [Gammaproteobacteria bacterium]|nr:hypothetical protein [Gammaproteobacteria bacterium]
MRQWQHCYAQDGIAILYNQGFAWSSDFATRAAKAAEGESHISTLPWSDDESTTSHKRTIGRIVRETREHPHIGIVLAGAPWNSAEWISSLATDETAAPVFIGPFTSDPTKLQQIALTSKSTIFAASQYWTNPNDKLQKKFTDDTIKRLDWSQEVLITPIALQAYDAAVLIERAYTSMQSSSQQFGERWWLDLGTIQGIKGTLDLYDDVTVSPAADLVRVDRSGTISFYPTTAACPP